MPDNVRLDEQQKILIALAAAMGAGCRTCADRLSAMAAEAGVPGHELEHAFAVGLLARETATETIRAKATSLLGHPPRIEPDAGKEPHVLELCRLAAAAAANSAPDVLHYAEAARSAGASEVAIDVAIGIARSVRAKAQGFSDGEIGASRGLETTCPTETPDASLEGRGSGRERRGVARGEAAPVSEQACEAACSCSPAGGAPPGAQLAETSGGRAATPDTTVPPAARDRRLWERARDSIESLPLGPLWLGLALAAAIAALYLGWCAAFDSTDQLIDPSQPLSLATGTRIHLVIAILIAFFLATRRYIDRRSPLELTRLQPLTCCSREELARIVEEHRALHQRRLRQAQGIGGLVGLAVLPATAGDPAVLLRAQGWDAPMLWGVVTSALLFALMGGAAYETVVDRRVLGRITREISEINLLDQGPLEPFARQGLRRAFLWAGGSTIASLLALDVQRLWPLLAVLAATLLLATLAFLEPARSVRARLRDAKQGELARVRSEIVRVKELALRSGGGSESARLPGLLAYESRIEAVREWPFDTPTLAHFAALAVLATASWLGGAVVERILGSILD
jgi:alkylhydroperoxidase/carboxymuconolactone decarboxylase family protein YurZ